MSIKLNCPLITDFQSNEDFKINTELELDISTFDLVDFIDYDDIYSLPFFDYKYKYHHNYCIKYKVSKKYIINYYYNKNINDDNIFKLVGFMCYFNEDDYKNNKSFMYHDYINNIYKYSYLNMNIYIPITFIVNKILVINNICFLFDTEIDNYNYIEKINIDISNKNFIAKIYDKYKIYIDELEIRNDISSDIILPEFYQKDEVFDYISNTFFISNSLLELKFID
jgi:hypothetical protein